MREALMWFLTMLGNFVDRHPLWATYLILLVLSMGAWCLAVLAYVSIADAMMSFRRWT